MLTTATGWERGEDCSLAAHTHSEEKAGEPTGAGQGEPVHQPQPGKPELQQLAKA